MSQWPFVELHKVAKISSGDGAPQESSAFGETGTPFIRAGSLTPLHKGISEMQLELILEAESQKRKMRKFPAATIVFAKSGMSCTKGLVYELQAEAHIVNHLAAIECCNKLSSRFLLRWLQLNPPSRLIANPSYPSIRISDIRSEQIPLPPLAEQKRIAAILDAADAMRAKRREAIALLDTLLQSTFLEMFGDPVTNPMGWEIGVIGDLLKSTTYGSSKKANSEKGSYPILRMNNITYSGEWDFRSLKYIDLDEKELPKHLVHRGEILFNRTNSKELVGKTAVFRKSQPMAFAGYLVRGIVNESADPEYIGAFMNTPQIKTFLRNKCKNIVGMTNINAKEFQNIPIPKPPVDLQRRFATIVESVEHQKALHRAHLAELDTLFASLQQLAFNGELSK